MKALIFGGTGFIGKHLCSELLSADYKVTIVSRNPKNSGLSGSGAEVVEWDVSAGALPVELLDGVSLIVNLAGESIGNRRWTPPVKEKILQSRVQITQAIVNAIKKQKVVPAVLINASAVGFYGPREDAEITENTLAGHDFLAEVCQAWEEEAFKAQTSGVRVVVVRIGVVLGDEGALARMKAPFRFYIGGPMGAGTQWMSWIHVKDLTRLIRFVAENQNISGPVNATAPEPVVMTEFCNTLGQVMGRPSWLPVPGFLLQAVLGEMSAMLLNSQRVLPRKVLKEGFSFRFPALQNALLDIIQQQKV